MFIKSLRMQLFEMLRKKTVIFTFLVVLAFVMINFCYNMFNNYKIQYISQMYDPIKILTLSEWSVSGYFFTQFFPLLVVIPTACAYLTDRDSKMKIYIESRIGKADYWYGKLVSVFITTFLVFTVPFIIEIVLNVICFDLKSAGDPSNFSYVHIADSENMYLFYQLFFDNKILYAIVMTCLFGAVSGILAMFNFAVTTLPFFKYKIFTFFPIYVLLYILLFLEKTLDLNYTINYFYILRMFETSSKNYTAYIIFLALLLIGAFCLIQIKTKKDDLI